MQEGNKLYKIIGICLVLSLVITIVTSNIVSITALTLINTGSVVSGGTGTVPTTGTGDTTAASSSDTTPSDTQVNVTVIDTTGSGTVGTTSGGGTVATTKSSGNTNTTKAASKTKSNAEIATLYNNAVNKTKAFTGKVKMHRVEGITTTMKEFSVESLKNKAQEMLPNDYPKTKDASYNGGKNTADANELFTKQIPPPSGKQSSLVAAGIKTATYKATATGCIITIQIVQETGNDINYVPPYHSSCIDTLSITADDIKPFTLKEAKVIYQGAKITATVNKNGLLTALSVYEPVNVSGKLSLGLSIDAVLDGLWRQDFTFTY